MRRAFSLMEIIIVIGILATLVAMSIPAFTQYLIRSDLTSAVQTTTQALARARILATSGQEGDSWSYAASGVVFRGASYATRDTTYDELYLLPEKVTASGLLVVSFQKLTGSPNQTGSIVLQSFDHESRVTVDARY